MKKRVFIAVLFFIIPLLLFAQKVPVSVIRNNTSATHGWQILDENYGIVFQGSEFFRSDTIAFSLEANKRYYFYCSVITQPGEPVDLYTLTLDNEPLLVIASDLGAGDHFTAFFTGVKAVGEKITGGTNALISEFPWQVFIEVTILNESFICGGSIISDEWILTAAHCVTSESGAVVSPSAISVVAGANNPYSASDGHRYGAAQVIRHEIYSDITLENDIALIRLGNPIDIPQAQPVQMVTREDVLSGATDPGVMAWVTGWGLSSVDPDVYPNRLQKVQLPIVTNQQAMRVWRSIPSTVLMAGYREGNKDACGGDSGGPLVVPVMGDYRLAGIVSWGKASCDSYGAYTRVSLFESWIRGHTGIQPLFKPPVPAGADLVCQGQSTGSYTVEEVPGISSYEWRLSPAAAGSVSGTSVSATVSWNTSYSGPVSLAYKVIKYGEYSDWSKLNINVARNTRLISLTDDTEICGNESVNLQVIAEGNDLNYSWYRNGLLFREGAGNILAFSPAVTDDTGIYHVQISGSCGNVTSPGMSLTVYPVTGIASVSPDASIPFGGDYTLNVEAEGHNLAYQWLKDNIPLGNAISSDVLIEDANAKTIGNYSVTVSGTCGVVRSDDIYLFVEGQSEAGGPEALLWPSVTSSGFNIAVSGDSFYDLNIYNTAGRIVRTYRSLQYHNLIDISDLGGGLYIVTVFNNHFRKTLRVIKK